MTEHVAPARVSQPPGSHSAPAPSAIKSTVVNSGNSAVQMRGALGSASQVNPGGMLVTLPGPCGALDVSTSTLCGENDAATVWLSLSIGSSHTGVGGQRSSLHTPNEERPAPIAMGSAVNVTTRPGR